MKANSKGQRSASSIRVRNRLKKTKWGIKFTLAEESFLFISCMKFIMVILSQQARQVMVHYFYYGDDGISF